MEEASRTKTRSTRGAKALSVEEAREKILAKLRKAGAKGAAAIHPKVSPEAAATYRAALAELSNATPPEIHIDERGTKPRYFLHAFRPKVPTAESVAEELLPFIRAEHPRIHSEATLKKPAVKKQLGLSNDEVALIPRALAALCDAGKLIALEYAPTAKRVTLYSVSNRASAAAPPREEALAPAQLREAYDALVRQTGFPAVPIARLASFANVELSALKDHLRAEYRAGRVVLSLGDWSIADEEERRGVIELHGERYLQVRWL